MVLVSPFSDLKVHLADRMLTADGNAYKTIRVRYGGVENLDISLRRTIRFPDNGSAYGTRCNSDIGDHFLLILSWRFRQTVAPSRVLGERACKSTSGYDQQG